ncbi:LysR family transcriptional regulator [Coralliovum pocilloporae]|uniref:LysR family transcriptional regulator n=1 Tax=Coralliovum pocilloporae TaxID=3066369 RepID=UPI0033073691
MYSIVDLQTFIAVARQGGITAAASHLRISAATTSHRIAKLEATLGIKLFHRNSRNVTISHEGLIFLEKVEPILLQLQEAEQAVGVGESELRGHLRVTTSPWILSRFIMPHLARFRTRHPDLTIDFLTVDRYVSLVEEGLDCAIRVGNLTDSSLIARKLGESDRIICAAPEFLDQHGTPASLDDLEDALWVCLPWQSQFTARNETGSARRLTISRSVTVSNSDILTDAALQGLGITVKSRLAVARELAAGSLVEIMPGVLEPSSAPIWFLYPPNGRNSRKTMEFSRLVQSAFKDTVTEFPTAEPGTDNAQWS